MRKLTLLIFIAIFVLLASIIVVDESQDAIVRSGTAVKVYSRGIHFVVPFVDQVSYIYMNERSSLLVLELKNGQIKVVLNWHVTDPVKYDTLYKESEPFSVRLVAAIHEDLAEKINSTSLADLNHYGIKGSYIFSDLGISIDKISILNINESKIVTAKLKP